MNNINGLISASRNLLKKIPGASRAYHLICGLPLALKPIVMVNIQGNKMYLDRRDRSISTVLLREGIYEDFTTRLFEKIVKPGMVVVDVGANVGYYTLIAARLVGAAGKVYAFEPEPHNYELLLKNISANRYTNIIPVNKAISNKTEKTKLYIDKIDFGRHSFSEGTIIEDNGSVEVETITLDDFFRESLEGVRSDFIKIDAEGAEGLIIEGAERILKNNVSIFMEFFPRALRNAGTDPLELLNKLEAMGFNIKMIIDEIRKRLDYENLPEMIELLENAKCGEAVNILFEK